MVADGAEPPIDKACGEGMMPETQAALRQLGVELPDGLGYRFQGIRFVQNDAQVAARFPEGQGIGVRRTLLHELLIQRAKKCGVKLLWKTPIAGIEPRGVQLRGGTVAARWIIGADGGHSRVRRWCELDSAVTNSQRIARRRHYHLRPWSVFTEVHWGPRVQAYVTPISPEEVCIVVVGETAVDADFESALEAMPELRERLRNAQLCSRERGAITAMQSLARVWRGNVALVGDASGGVDAITGEGLRLAFRQALALAAAIQYENLREYELAHRRLARRPTWMGRLLLLLGRNDSIRQRVLRRMSRNPQLFARMLAIHAGRVTPGAVVVMGAQFGWQFLAN